MEAIRVLAEPILAEAAMELVELSCRSQGRQHDVRLLVDRVGGVTIQQCAQVNSRLSGALENSQVIEGSFTVEVSSPGLDRPLVQARDFQRALGEEVQVECRCGADGRLETLRGQLLAVQQEAIVVKTPSGNLTVPLSQIRKAQKYIRW